MLLDSCLIIVASDSREKALGLDFFAKIASQCLYKHFASFFRSSQHLFDNIESQQNSQTET